MFAVSLQEYSDVEGYGVETIVGVTNTDVNKSTKLIWNHTNKRQDKNQMR